jgi:ParB-like chromosome segregation protein Spo0J
MSVVTTYTELLPKLTNDEYERLKADIQANGVRVPVIVDEDGTVLDGRHRWQICEELGLECPTALPVSGLSDYEKRLLSVSVNVNRRHLTDAQRALVGIDIEPDVVKRAEERMLAGVAADPPENFPEGSSAGNKGDSRDETAAMVGLGAGRTYENHKKVLKKVEEEHPDLIEPLKAGVTVDEDGKEVITTMKWARKKINDREAKAQQAEITAEQSFIAPVVTVQAAVDWLTGVEKRSVDLLITDPPYSTDVDDIAAFASDWVNPALDLLKLSGRAFICTGAYPVELNAYLSVLLQRDDVTVANVLAWHYPDTLGPSPSHDYKAAWQAIFHLRGPDAPPLNAPILTESTTVQKINMNSGIVGGRVHSWQKPDVLAERLILHATKPGDTVVDCFAGTGTFLVTAGRLGRVAYGCELNREMADLAAERGCNIV